ncbi:MAG: hypothetical protein L6R43_02135 [Planctomycetes bacterium]|nr:hypothetical protein [Planctomycetota bacterium]
MDRGVAGRILTAAGWLLMPTALVLFLVAMAGVTKNAYDDLDRPVTLYTVLAAASVVAGGILIGRGGRLSRAADALGAGALTPETVGLCFRDAGERSVARAAARLRLRVGKEGTEGIRRTLLGPRYVVPLLSGGGVCTRCSREAATHEVTYEALRGLLFLYSHRAERGMFCGICSREVHRDCQKSTGAEGWWGVKSFFMTPIVLLSNDFRLRGAPPPDPDAPLFLSDGSVFRILEPAAPTLASRLRGGHSFRVIVAAAAEAASVSRPAAAAYVLALASELESGGTRGAPAPPRHRWSA